MKKFEINGSKTLLIVETGLLIAITFVMTTVVKIPTPVMGYVHAGDGAALFAGLFLGPLWGSFAGAAGSMLSDIFGGYMVFAPGTFVIKFLMVLVSSLIMKKLSSLKGGEARPGKHFIYPIISGVAGEAVMIAGYFLYNIFLMMFINNGAGSVTLSAAIAASATEMPFNAVQGIFGVVIYSLLYHIKK